MAQLLFPDDLFHDYLRLKFPGKFLVCVQDSEDESKRVNALRVLETLFPPITPTLDAPLPLPRTLQLYDTGYALLVCDTQDEAFQLYRHFDNELDFPYSILFGPCASEPRGTVLTENT